MGGIDLNKYLTDIPEYTTGRLRYNPVNMLKTVLFGFMTSSYCSLRELDTSTFVYGSGKRKSKEQRHYEHLTTFFAHDFSHLYTTCTKREMRKSSIEFFHIPFCYLRDRETGATRSSGPWHWHDRGAL